MTTLELKGICLAGGSVVVDATQHSTLDLKGIAMAAQSGHATLTIRNASKLTSLSCKGIALAGGSGTVIFDFSNF